MDPRIHCENKPYDRMVRELITARGSTFQNPPANFFRFTRDPKLAMETTTQLFLGVRMVCAQCHDHPFEKWTQNQYFQLTAFFGARWHQRRHGQQRRDRLREARGCRRFIIRRTVA